MLGDAPATRGRVAALLLLILVCGVGAVSAVTGGQTGDSVQTAFDYAAVPFVVVFVAILVRELRRLR